MKLHADISLSSGRIIRFSPMANGAQSATPTTGPQEMTEAEYAEYAAETVRRNAEFLTRTRAQRAARDRALDNAWQSLGESLGDCP